MLFKVSAFLSAGFLVLPAAALRPHLTSPDVPATVAPAPRGLWLPTGGRVSKPEELSPVCSCFCFFLFHSFFKF